MKPNTAPGDLTLPPALLIEVKRAADEEHRPVAEMLCDLIEQGLVERRQWQAHAEKERQRARELGIHHPADNLPMTDDYRQSVRDKIAQGLQSLRKCKGTDGERFFAEMYADLDELERQGRE